MSILVAIDECTTESGCLWLAEGVDEPLPTDDRGVVRDDVVDSLHWAPAELAAGDAVLLDGLAPHYSDANRGDRRRRARRQLRAVWRALLARALLPARADTMRRASQEDGRFRISTLADFAGVEVPWRTRHRTGARISRWRRLDRQVLTATGPPAPAGWLDVPYHQVRTCVRVRCGDHPACRPRRLLCLRRATGRSSVARPPGDRRGGSRARSQLRGEGVRDPHGDGRRAGPGAVPARGRGRASHVRVLDASEAVFEVFDHTTPLVEGLSIDEAFLDVGGLRRLSGPSTDIAVQLRRDVRDQVGLPITVGVARTKFLAKVASAVASPTGCSWCLPTGSWSSCTRSPSNGSGEWDR